MDFPKRWSSIESPTPYSWEILRRRLPKSFKKNHSANRPTDCNRAWTQASWSKCKATGTDSSIMACHRLRVFNHDRKSRSSRSLQRCRNLNLSSGTSTQNMQTQPSSEALMPNCASQSYFRIIAIGLRATLTIWMTSQWTVSVTPQNTQSNRTSLFSTYYLKMLSAPHPSLIMSSQSYTSRTCSTILVSSTDILSILRWFCSRRRLTKTSETSKRKKLG